jgi:hypothetical protein
MPTRYVPNHRRFKRDVESEINKGLRKAAQDLERKLKQNLSGQRSGESYYVGELNATYTASAPGEFPAVRLNNLRPSVESIVDSTFNRAFVGTNLEYGLDLELKDPRQGGRPWLRPTLDANRERIADLVANG